MGHPVLIRTGLVSEKFGTALHYILQVFVQKKFSRMSGISSKCPMKVLITDCPSEKS